MAEFSLKPLPFEEAKAFWANKVQLGPGEFKKLTDEAKLAAFSVTGIAKGDELATVYNAMGRALADGIPFSQFKADCASIFERRGWTGLRAWRVDNIFRTNIQTAYNVGRYKQMEAVKDAFPYWMYDAVNDSRTRPTHRAMDGKVYPAGHPFWDTWYPPNGFRCRCSVQPLTAGQVARRGLKIETEDLTGTPLLPPGGTNPIQLLPDPGFSHHPGKTVWGGLVEDQGLAKYTDLAGLKSAAGYNRPSLQDVGLKLPARPALLPTGMEDGFYRAEFVSRYGEEKLITDVAGEPVILSLRAFMQDKTPGSETWKFSKPGHGEIIPAMEEMVKNPFEVWLTPQQDQYGKIRLVKRYLSLWQTDDKRAGGALMFEVVRGVFQGVTAFLPLRHGRPDLRYLEKQRQGLLLYGEK